MFASKFTALIKPKFMLEPELFFTDRHGTRWRRVDATELQLYDLGELQSTVREEVFARELYWLQRLQGEPGLPAVQVVQAHGWAEPDDLLYAVLVEAAEAPLVDLFVTGTLELRLPGSTKLLVARSLGSYLETAETLHARFGLVSPSLCPQVVNVRSDWQSAFLSNLELQAASPALAHTSGWPYFSAVGPIPVSLSDCYLAAIVCYLEFLAPRSFLELSKKGTRQSGPMTPQEFGQALLADESWTESNGTSARSLLRGLLCRGEKPLDSEWRAEVRRAFAILASTCAHASSAELGNVFGLRLPQEENQFKQQQVQQELGARTYADVQAVKG